MGENVSNKLLALKLVLEALGVGTSIDDVNERKGKQKAIYLAKVLGLNLGYSYGWYVRGPYSPSLTKDYYELDASSDTLNGTLRPDIAATLQDIRTRYIESPEKPEEMSPNDWLELIASWHFLRETSKKSVEEATETFNLQKPHLVESVQVAERLMIGA